MNDIPDDSAAAAFAQHVYDHWGTGPGRLLPDSTTPGWHPYSDLPDEAFARRLQIESATHASGIVTLVFVQAGRRLVAVVEPTPGSSAAALTIRLWHALTPLAEHPDMWEWTAHRLGPTTFSYNLTAGPDARE